MYKIYLAVGALIIIAGGYYLMSSRISQVTEPLGDPGIRINKAQPEPEDEVINNDDPFLKKAPEKKKKGLVISRPIDPDDDKPVRKDEPEVNEYGRKMVPEPETVDKKTLKASQEFNDKKEDPADYDKVPMPEKDMDLDDYYNKKKRDD